MAKDVVKDLKRKCLDWVSGWALKTMTHILKKTRGEGCLEGHRVEGGHVTTDPETGVMWPQVREHLGPPEAGRGRWDSPLWPSEAQWPC